MPWASRFSRNGRSRLTEADLPGILATLEGSGLRLNLPPTASAALVRLVRRYDVYLCGALELASDSLAIMGPDERREARTRWPGTIS